MSKIEFELTAKEAQMVAAWKRGRQSIETFNRELDRVGGKTRKNQQQGNRFFNSVRAGARNGASSLDNMATSLLGISATVGTVKAAYSEWRQEMQAIGTEATQFHRKLIADLAESGDLLQGDRVRGVINDITTATRSQSLSAFGGVRGAAPAIPLDRALDLTKEAAKAGTIFDAEKLGDLGGVAGFIGSDAPEKKAGDVLDLAQAVRADLGDRISESNSPAFRRGVQLLQNEVGLSQEKALATMVEAIRSGKLRAGTAGDAFAGLAGDIPTVASPRNNEDRLRNRLSKLSPAERFELALQDDDARKALFGKTNAAKLGALSPELIDQETQRLRRAQTDDQFARDISAVEKQFPVNAAERRAEAQLDASKRPLETRERARANRRKRLDTQLNQNDRNFVTRFGSRAALATGEALADIGIGTDSTNGGNPVPRVQPKRNDASLEVLDAVAANPKLGQFVQEQQAAGRTMKEILAVLKQQQQQAPPPIKVNVRVQNPAAAQPRPQGAAALGVRGG